MAADVAAGNAVASLEVVHWAAPLPRQLPAVAGALLIDTCLRRLAVAAGAPAGGWPPGGEHRTGIEAYEFLLQVATGLRSAVPGETNVLGQIRQAWNGFVAAAGTAGSAVALSPVIGRLLADARLIRTQYLQGIGGASYGTLTRRLLQPEAGERILVVGSGNLARSLLPFLRAFDVAVCSRQEPDAYFQAASRHFALGHGAAAAHWADHVILTTPPDAMHDSLWSGWLADAKARTIIHLGRRATDGRSWLADRERVFDLDHLFELRSAQANVRSLQLQRAQLACRERARHLQQAATATGRRRALG